MIFLSHFKGGNFINKRDTERLLVRLNKLPGVSGNEGPVRDALIKAIVPHCDYYYTDTIGNIFFVRRGGGSKTALISAHMDEVGFIVSGITARGQIEFIPIGLHDRQLIKNQALYIQSQKGDIAGVTGALSPPHLKKTLEQEPASDYPFLLDIGAKSSSEARNMEVEIGNTIYGARGGIGLGNGIFSGRAVDNRAGCAAMAAAMSLIHNSRVTVIASGTVMEELGGKGAKAAVYERHPDIAVVLDTTFAHEGKDEPAARSRCELGGGACVSVYDWSPGSLMGGIAPAWLRERVFKAAAENGIPFQREVVLNCGTDAAEIALAMGGIAAIGINVPCRYMHSAVGTVDTRDVWNAARLTAAVINSI